MFGKGSSDPYVLMTCGDATHRTETVKACLAPTFNETFQFHFENKDTCERSEIDVVVRDWDRYSKDDVMGSATLKSLLKSDRRKRLVNLNTDPAGGKLLVRLTWSDDQEKNKNNNRLGPLRLCTATIDVLRAENLPRSDRMHSTDPYVVLRCDSAEGYKTKKTKMIKSTTTPTWNESVSFEFPDRATCSEAKIRIEIKDWDRITRDDLVCEGLIDLSGQGPQDRVIELVNTSCGKDKDKKSGGKLYVRVRLCHTVYLKITRAENLPAADWHTKTSDPYVVLSLSLSLSLSLYSHIFTFLFVFHRYVVASIANDYVRHKTKIVTKTLSPEFNETFEFHFSDRNACDVARIDLSVFDWDVMSKDDLLCTSVLRGLTQKQRHRSLVLTSAQRKVKEGGTLHIEVFDQDSLIDDSKKKDRKEDIDVVESKNQESESSSSSEEEEEDSKNEDKVVNEAKVMDTKESKSDDDEESGEESKTSVIVQATTKTFMKSSQRPEETKPAPVVASTTSAVVSNSTPPAVVSSTPETTTSKTQNSKEIRRVYLQRHRETVVGGHRIYLSIIEDTKKSKGLTFEARFIKNRKRLFLATVLREQIVEYLPINSHHRVTDKSKSLKDSLTREDIKHLVSRLSLTDNQNTKYFEMKIVLRPESRKKDPLDITRCSTKNVPRRPQRHERVIKEVESLSLEERLDQVRKNRRTREDKIRERLFKFDRQYETRKQQQEENRHQIRVRRFEASRASARRRAAAAAASIQRRRDWDQRRIDAEIKMKKKMSASPYVAPEKKKEKKEPTKLLSDEERARLVKGNERALKYKKKGRLGKAESILRKLLKNYSDSNSKQREHPFVLIVLNNLAGILQDQKKLDEAEKIFREVLGMSSLHISLYIHFLVVTSV